MPLPSDDPTDDDRSTAVQSEVTTTQTDDYTTRRYDNYNGGGRRPEFDWSLVQSLNRMPDEKWFVKNWRPMMAWVYMLILLFDFITAPLALIALSAWLKTPYSEWHPLTLQGGGLIHMTFMAVLGITAWGRTKEKIDPNANDKSG